MRDFSKALENIRKAIQDQDTEFRREEGLDPRKPKPAPKIPSLKPELEQQTSQKDSGGKFAADRFLNESIGQESAQAHTEHQPQDTAPEFVEVIPQKDSRHSWLYNEVAKAVQNASDGNPNTKVVAVFVPVVQSGHEFEELPVHETVELPPVHEEDFNIEDEIDIQDDPVTTEQEPQEQEPLEQEPLEQKEDALTPQEPQEEQQEPEIFADEAQEQAEQAQEVLEQESLEQETLEQEDQAQEALEQEDTDSTESEQNTETEQNEPEELDSVAQEPLELEPEMPEISEALSEKPEQAEHLDELLPESIEHPDPELAEAYNTMEEKLDETLDQSIAEDLPELEFHDELEDDEFIDVIDESSEDTNAI